MLALARLLTASSRPSGPLEHLRRETVVSAPLTETFAFFAEAANLAWLTPPSLGFTVVTPLPVTMRVGLEIDYRISVHGMRMPWRSVIDVWEPGVSFIDRQTIGPYRWWRHEHRFDSVPGGTRIIDHVEYMPRLRWVTAALVRRELEHIFDYREATLRRHFEASADEHRHA
jgi:ligand-binding SRPBCC domain-containing protein